MITEEKLKCLNEEYEKCKKSLVYYAENYIRVSIKDGLETKTRKLNTYEISLLETIEKARKEGKSLILSRGLNRK